MVGIAAASPRLKARLAGGFEVLEAVSSGFGEIFVIGMPVHVRGDATATAKAQAALAGTSVAHSRP